MISLCANTTFQLIPIKLKIKHGQIHHSCINNRCNQINIKTLLQQVYICLTGLKLVQTILIGIYIAKPLDLISQVGLIEGGHTPVNSHHEHHVITVQQRHQDSKAKVYQTQREQLGQKACQFAQGDQVQEQDCQQDHCCEGQQQTVEKVGEHYQGGVKQVWIDKER